MSQKLPALLLAGRASLAAFMFTSCLQTCLLRPQLQNFYYFMFRANQVFFFFGKFLPIQNNIGGLAVHKTCVLFFFKNKSVNSL